MALELSTPAFAPGGDIPVEHTCDGADVSPALQWTVPPDGTVSLALVVDDPDAPGRTWVHWVLYNIPPAQRELPEHVEAKDTLPSGARHGTNDFGRVGYGGPCPPPGPAHRYFFRLYALDTALELRHGAKRRALDAAMKGHVLASAELVGRYQRGSRRR
jgi:Raf kinase inhibitor-like YbhB/YbcL family protein